MKMENTEQLAAPESAPVIDAGEGGEDQSQETGELAVIEQVEAVEEDDSEELDYEGRKFKAPPGVKDALLRHGDYTRKTQEVADLRRNIEHQQLQVRQQAEFQQAHIRDFASVISIDERLAQFANLDWNALTDADPVQAMKLERQVRELQGQKNNVLQQIEQAQQRQAFEREQSTFAAQEQGRRELELAIPGFRTPELKQALKATGKALGFTDAELGSTSDKRAVLMLHKAYLYDQLVAKASAKPKVEAVKPVTRLSAKTSPASVDEDKMSADEWRAYRNKQIAQKRRA